jgi:hypothetical protein
MEMKWGLHPGNQKEVKVVLDVLPKPQDVNGSFPPLK